MTTCIDSLLESSLKNEETARLRCLLDQIMSEIRNTNILLEAAYFEEADEIKKHRLAEASNPINCQSESVMKLLGMDKKASFEISNERLYSEFPNGPEKSYSKHAMVTPK